MKEETQTDKQELINELYSTILASQAKINFLGSYPNLVIVYSLIKNNTVGLKDEDINKFFLYHGSEINPDSIRTVRCNMRKGDPDYRYDLNWM